MNPITKKMNNGGWVYVKPESESGLVEKLMSADILISDLDGTDAKSPAMELAFGGLKRADYLSNPRFWEWAITTAFNLLRKNKDAHSDAWSDFIENFLRDTEELERIKDHYKPEALASQFYPGVRDFYELLPEDMIKIYATRNIKEITESFRKAAGFHEAIPEQFDKVRSLDEIFKKYPSRRKVIIKEDSTNSAEELLDFLESKERRGLIDYFVGIFVNPISKGINLRYDINIGRNYFGLVHYLNNGVTSH